jgi:hypothetical protein
METSAGQSAPGQAKDKVQHAAGQATDQARGRVADVVTKQSTNAGEQVNSAADALRQTSSQLRESGKEAPARAMDTAAERIEGVGNWLRDSDGDQILHDVENLARRQPTAVIFGGLALGFVASRLLRASSSKRYQSTSGNGSLDRYRTTGYGTSGRAAGGTAGTAGRTGAGVGTGALSGSPTSGLTAEGDSVSAPTSRMGLESDVRRGEGGLTPPRGA